MMNTCYANEAQALGQSIIRRGNVLSTTSETITDAGFLAALAAMPLINGAIKHTTYRIGIAEREDLVQDAILTYAAFYDTHTELWGADPDAFRAQVYQKIRWLLLDKLRREKWLTERIEHDEAALANLPLAGDTELAAITQALRSLAGTDRERAVVEYHWLRGIPLAQVAAATGVPVRSLRAVRTTLRTRLRRLEAI